MFFAAPDGKKVAIEWDWAITRKRDGNRGISHDAIMVDLKDGKIASWREYYDPAASGEAKP
jgi:ketosteroid isomerase-like protein